MAMPYQPWRAAMLPASFRGVGFKVDTNSQSGGRRGPTHEFPNSDTPYTEDMGRRARRWPVTGYIIGPNYLPARDALIAALDADGAATLVLPTLGSANNGSIQAKCDTYSVTETRERGGICTFQMLFVEQGALNFTASTNTQAATTTAANNLTDTTSQSIEGINANNQTTGDASESFNPNAPDTSVPFNANNVEVNPTPGVTAPYAGQGAISGHV